MAAARSYITVAGNALLASALAQEKAVRFVKAELGTGVPGEESEIVLYDSLVNVAFDENTGVVMSGGSYQGDGTAIISVQFSGGGVVTEAMLITEIGIYAALDGAEDVPVLFAYIDLGDNSDRIFPTSQAGFYRFYDCIINFSGSSDSFSAVVASSAVVPSVDTSHVRAADKLIYSDKNQRVPIDIAGDADTVDGKHAQDLAQSDHGHDVATYEKDGFMSAADKEAFDRVSSSVDQNVSTTSSPVFAGLTVNGIIYGARFE